MLCGVKNKKKSFDIRLPISVSMLKTMNRMIYVLSNSHYMEILMQAMFTLALFALLRIGEIAVKRGNLSSKVLQLCNVSWQNNKRILIIVLLHFKHNSSGTPVTLELREQSNAICPVTIMSKYLSIRSSKQGPLFIFVDGSPITVSFFNLELKKYLRSSGFSIKIYQKIDQKSQSSHHPQEVHLAQFSLYVHKSGLKPDSFHFEELCRWLYSSLSNFTISIYNVFNDTLVDNRSDYAGGYVSPIVIDIQCYS